jgi:hypothetical protein
MSHNVLIVVDRTDGNTTFKRSYMSDSEFKFKRTTDRHVGFEIPKEVTMNDVTDECSRVMTQQCIAIKAKNGDLSGIINPAFILTKKNDDGYTIDSYKLFYTKTEGATLNVAPDSIELDKGVLIQDETEAKESEEPVAESDFWGKLKKLAKGGVESAASANEFKSATSSIGVGDGNVNPQSRDVATQMEEVKSEYEEAKQKIDELQKQLDTEKEANAANIASIDLLTKDEQERTNQEIADAQKRIDTRKQEIRQLKEFELRIDDLFENGNNEIDTATLVAELIQNVKELKAKIAELTPQIAERDERIAMGANDTAAFADKIEDAKEINEIGTQMSDGEQELKDAANKAKENQPVQGAPSYNSETADALAAAVSAQNSGNNSSESVSGAPTSILPAQSVSEVPTSNLQAAAVELASNIGNGTSAKDAVSQLGQNVADMLNQEQQPGKRSVDDFLKVIENIGSIEMKGGMKGGAFDESLIQRINKFIYKEQPIFYKLNALRYDDAYKALLNGDYKEFMKDYLKVILIDINLIVATSTSDDYVDIVKATNAFMSKEIIDAKHKDTLNEIVKLVKREEGLDIESCHILRMSSFMNDVIRNKYGETGDDKAKIINAYMEQYTKLIEKNIDEYSTKLSAYNESTFASFVKAVDELMQKQENSKLLSYLKISNHEDGERLSEHSARYKLNFDNAQKPTFLKLGYNTSIEPLSDKNNQDRPVAERESMNDEPYILGKFNRILLPYKGDAGLTGGAAGATGGAFIKQTNEDDANKIKDDIIDNLKAGNPLFMIGYGMSGSGKTTSIIYSETEDNKDGILIHLLKNIDGATSISVTCKEFSVDVTSDGVPVTFKKSNDEKDFVDEGGKAVGQHIAENIRGTQQEVNGTKGKRRVFATPNNPVSSRSHVVIHILVTDTDGKVIANLFVGDFAGVENRFIKDFKTACMFKYLYGKKSGEKLTGDELSEVAAEQAGLDKYNSETYVDVIQEYKNNKDLFDKLREVGIDKINETITALNTNSNAGNGNEAARIAVGQITTKVGNAADEEFERETQRMAAKKNNATTKVPTLIKPKAVPKVKPEAPPKVPPKAEVKISSPSRERVKNNSREEEAARNSAMIKKRTELEQERKERIQKLEEQRDKTKQTAITEASKLRNSKSVRDRRKSNTDKKTGGKKTRKKRWGGDKKDDATKYIGVIRDILDLGGLPNTEILPKFVKNASGIDDGVNAKEALPNILIALKKYKKDLDDAYMLIARSLDIETSDEIDYIKVIELADGLDKYVPYLDSFATIDARNKEGEFINTSLGELRADIRRILDKRNSKSIYYAPVIDPECIEQYCPTLNNCFNSSTEESDDSNSKIMEWVIEQSKKGKQSFEDSCVLSVFCVLNVTPGVNDPPVMPYVNTDKFEQILRKIQNTKTIVKNDDDTIETIEPPNVPADIAIRTIDTLLQQINQSLVGNKVGFPFSTTEGNYTYCTDRINEIDEYLQDEDEDESETQITKFDEIIKQLNDYLAKRNTSVAELPVVPGERPKRVISNKSEQDKIIFKDISTKLKTFQIEINKEKNEKAKIAYEKFKSESPIFEQSQTDNIAQLKTEFNTIATFIDTQKERPERVALKNIIDLPEFGELLAAMSSEISYDGIVARDTDVNVIWNIPASAEAFLEVMHKYNASTDIGTVKYLDNFAKSDTTDFMCIQTDAMNKDKYTVPYSTVMEDVHKT